MTQGYLLRKQAALHRAAKKDPIRRPGRKVRVFDYLLEDNMFCNKAQFTTRADAERALVRVRRDTECKRVYRCRCGYYHMTSRS